MATQRSGSETTKPASIIQYLDTEVPQFKANATAFQAEEMEQLPMTEI